MSQGNDFANYSEASSAESGGSEEVWFVAVSSDDIKQMNVDQLDEAFRLGIISGETAVWTEGMEAWAPLGQVADLDGESSGSEENAGATEPPHASTAPSHASMAGASGFGEVTLQSVQRGQPLGPSSVAPVTSSYAPSGQLGHGAGPAVLNADEEIPPLRQGRRFRPERWALAAAAVVAIGAAAFYSLDSSSVASAGTDAPAALAARPEEGSAARGERLGGGSTAEAQVEAAAAEPGAATAAAEGGEPSALGAGAAVAAGAVAAKAMTSGRAEDAEEASPSSKASESGEKDSLKGSFSKAIGSSKASSGKKSASRAKAKPRKAKRAATKSRSAKPRAAKKSSVPRTQSAFDPLNDSLP